LQQAAKYSINQSIDGFETFQSMNIVLIFIFFQLGS